MTRIEKVAEVHHIKNPKQILLTCNAMCPSQYGLLDECSTGEERPLNCVTCWLREYKEDEK